MMDMPINGKLLVVSQDHPRLKYGQKNFLKYSDESLLEAVKEYELWLQTREYRLNYTICAELTDSNKEEDLFEAYDAICREIARRSYLKRAI